jgi:hypothetical protein
MKAGNGSWANFKTICITNKALNLQSEEMEGAYRILGPDKNNITWDIILPKLLPDPDNEGQTITNPDVTDFLANVASTCNAKIITEQLDSDGASMSRVKVAPSGWNFHLRMVEFNLSTAASLYNKSVAGVDIGDATIKLYDADGVLITDPANEVNCVKTVLDLEPPYDIYVAGGNVRSESPVTTDVRVSVIAVPDVPANYGGSKPFVQNINMKFVNNNTGVNADGRAAKWLQYNATYHTNKLRFQFTHPAGSTLKMGITVETYKQ